MKKFSDLGIKSEAGMTGSKITIARILNREITVLSYRIEDSKFPKNKSGKCLFLQIEVDNEKKVVFTESDVLLSHMNQVLPEDLTSVSTLIQHGEHFELP